MLPVVMMVGRSGRLKELVFQEFRIEAEKEDEYQAWIERPRGMYDEEMTNALAVWDLIIRQVCKRSGVSNK